MKTIADTYIDEGKREGEYNKAMLIAKKMFFQGFKVSVIAELIGLNESLIRSIAKK
ncbi:terminase gpP N-terminus-related DNA-binding protein [Rickettsia endosymbiont of Pantilius tunicatus]|uniref:terminase gpP N-terminus-related DNA-binding protein n=1 Tax=Rickettsia endosymbiont of Pantilius tunicatus TaxID=3066267 RepID=UPI0030E56A3D